MEMLDYEESMRIYKRSIYKAVDNEFIRKALRRSITSYMRDREKALERFPHVRELAKEVRRLKEEVIAHLDDYTKKTIGAVEEAKGHAYYAKTVEDALKIVDEIVGSGKLVVKSKSITGEELDINQHLEGMGNEVYETDLGEYIIQQLGDRPMHLVTPAIHIPKEAVAELFSKITGKTLPPDPPTLTMVARDLLREKFFKADVGISGINAISSDTGSIFLVENEGNARFISNAPPVYIAIGGLEKIVPTMADGLKVVEVVSRYAGYTAPSFISIISGPSKTGDIEKTPVYGVHGPRDWHVILLDNGRSELAKDPVFKEALYCIRCGSCLYTCPIYGLTTGYFGHKYFGGIGSIWTEFVSGGSDKAAPMAYTCTLCNRCKEYCPIEIDTPRMVIELRRIIKEKGYIPKNVKKMVENTLEKGVPY
jgi:L-lactate dehydrogenase complex protein LldG